MTSHRVRSVLRPIALAVTVAALLAGPIACRSVDTTQDKLAAMHRHERRIAAKLTALVKRRDHLNERIEVYKKRLTEVQQRRQALEQKIARRTPHVIRPGSAE